MNTHFSHPRSTRRYSLQRRYIPSNKGRRRGSTLLLIGLGITVFLGAGALSIDYGLLVNDKNIMQRSCDAAALAGASRLKLTNDAYDTIQASNLAIDVAKRNGTTITASNITFLNGNRTIRVTSNATRSLFFARFLGRSSAAVAARATATLKGVDNLPVGYVKPIGITDTTYHAYKNDLSTYRDLMLIRQNQEIFAKDDLVLFDLRDTNAKSGAKMLEQLLSSPDKSQIVSIGDKETTLNASAVSEIKKLTSGLDELMDRAKKSPWYDNGPTLPSSRTNTTPYQPSAAYFALANGTASYDNPRVLNIIVSQETTKANNGTYDAPVNGFVPVYLEGYYEGSNTELWVRVRFLPPISSPPDQGNTTTTGSLTGFRTVSLIE